MKHYLTLILLLAASLPAMAQTAFSSMSLGLEVGTAGPGVSLFVPVVTDRLFVGASYHAPKMSTTHDFQADAHLNGLIQEVNKRGGQQLETLPNDKMTLTGKIKMDFTGFQVRAYFYPNPVGKFFMAGGVRVGQKDMIQIECKPDSRTWDLYQRALAADAKLPVDKRNPELQTAMKYSFDSHTFHFSPKSADGTASAILQTNSVCPYFGIGWGRAIPQRNRVGFQFEMGAWYHGKPKIVTNDELPYDASAASTDDVLRYIEDCPVYPQITFRLTGRIF